MPCDGEGKGDVLFLSLFLIPEWCNMRVFVLFLLLFFTVRYSEAQQVLTLDKALELAYEHNPSLVQTRYSLEESELNLKVQRASLRSQFSLNVSPFRYTRNNVYDSYNSTWYTSETKRSGGTLGITQPVRWTDGTISLVNEFEWQDATNKNKAQNNKSFNHDLSLRIEQPLFTYNRTRMRLKELELNLENARLNYEMRRLSLEKSVTSAYYNIYKVQKDLSITRDQYNNQKQNFEIIRRKSEAGLVKREEFYQARMNMASAEASVYSQEISLESVKDQFKLLIGLPLEEDILVLPDLELPVVNVDMNQAVSYGLEKRMELRQKEITLEKDVFDIIRAKAENEFKGNISVRVGLNALDEKLNRMYDKPTDNEQIGVSLTIPLIDWGAKKARVKSSELGREADELSLEEEKRTIVANIRDICRNLPVLLRQTEIRKENVENAEMTYRIQEGKYRDGNLSGMELLQYQNQLTQARQMYTNAVINYKVELLNLKIQTLWNFETGEPVVDGKKSGR